METQPVHYVDALNWRLLCAPPEAVFVAQGELWTFSAERVTCPECLRLIANTPDDERQPAKR